MRAYIAALAVFAAVPAQAGDIWLDINGASRHSKDTYFDRGKTHRYNESNLGLGLTYDANKYVGVTAGFYDNSYYQTTVYAGVRLGYSFVVGDVVVSPGIHAGYASGYADTPVHSSRLRPVVVPNLRVAYRGVGVTIGYVPRVASGDDATVSFSVVTAQVNINLLGKP